MTQEDLDTEIFNIAMSLEDEFGQDEDTVNTISELLCISHSRVLEVLLPDMIGS